MRNSGHNSTWEAKILRKRNKIYLERRNRKMKEKREEEKARRNLRQVAMAMTVVLQL